MRKKVLSWFVLLMQVVVLPGCSDNQVKEGKFENWNTCDSLTSLRNYVTKVVNKNSDQFIPVEDRIAVFDMDGTLYGELFPVYLEYLMLEYRALDDKTYQAPEDVKEVAMQIRDAKANYATPDVSNFDLVHARAAAKAYSGMTLAQFKDYTKAFIENDVECFTNMKYKDAFYQPMKEVVSYLQNNDFTTYVVSGSDRFLCRALVCDVLNIPENQIIGMDVRLEGSAQEGKDGLSYQFQKDDDLVRTDELLIKNLKMNKVTAIAKEIGKQPVLSFGNSSGDISMHVYTTSNNAYESQAYMLVADDTERDYAKIEEANKRQKSWQDYGFNIISMKNDFKTIYGSNVTKK